MTTHEKLVALVAALAGTSTMLAVETAVPNQHSARSDQSVPKVANENLSPLVEIDTSETSMLVARNN